MRLKFWGLLLVITTAIWSCETETGTTINGTIANAKNLTAHLDIKNLSNTVQTAGQTEVDANGQFSINFPEGLNPGMYRVRLGAKGVDLILGNDTKKVTINGDLNTLQAFDYTVTGSEESASYQQQIKGIIDKTISRPQLDKFIKESTNPMLAAALSLSTTAVNASQANLYKDWATKIATAYPKAQFGKDLMKYATDLGKQKQASGSKYKVNVGDPAPEIALPDVNGKTRKLSDLRGKIVLLDFWASWCGPCRKSNPHVVEMYKKYNAEGFEVFNVSLDGLDTRTRSRYSAEQIPEQLKKSKERWIAAIKQDKLSWDNHVSDLKKWESAGAALYGVRSIPTTFLIDREGKIAYLNPRSNLEEAIKSVI